MFSEIQLPANFNPPNFEDNRRVSYLVSKLEEAKRDDLMARTYLQYLKGCIFNTAISKSGVVELTDEQPDDLVSYAMCINEGRDPGEEPQVRRYVKGET